MRKLITATLFALVALTGCSTPPMQPQGPTAQVLPAKPYVVGQQTVFGAKGAYEAGLTIAVTYAELPRCGKGVLLCSDQKIVDQVVRARDVARDALRAAEGVVRSPSFGTDVVKTSVDAADAALRAFLSITNSLKEAP